MLPNKKVRPQCQEDSRIINNKQPTVEEYDRAFNEVSFLLDIFVETIETFVGKSTPALAVAAGRKMAAQLHFQLEEPTIENALREFLRFFRRQKMEIGGKVDGQEALIAIKSCPIRSVCNNRKRELDSQICQMFHYYMAGILAELTGTPARPKTVRCGEQCVFSLQFSKASR